MASAKLALRKAVLSYSTVTASTSLVSSINTRALTYSTLSGSTINAATLFVNGSQITSGGSSQWSTIGSTITYAGNVGIGTTPQYKLDVAGSVNVTGGFYVNGTAFTGGGGGGIIVPNTTSLSSSSWTASSVNWTASASSFLNGYNPHKVFNNTSADSWAPQSSTYTTTGNSSGVTTTIQGIGSIQGDWVQLQSSTPLVISSYQLATGGAAFQFPNTFYIIGSNDGTTWYPIHKCIGVAQTNTASNTFITGTIIAATSGSQTFGNSSLTTTTYATTTNSYTYFRLLGTNTYGTNSYLEVGEWYATFTTPSSAGSQWTTTGSNISYTGSVGIGISSPSYRLHVGVMDNTYNLAAYLGSGGIGNYSNNSLLNSTSLFIAGWGMTAAAWGVTSDRRIKTNIESVSSMLKIIDQINVVKYDYIDPRLGREECSVIAQELKEVFPNAINMTTDFITNIMKRCTHVRDYDTVTLHVSLDNTLCIQSGCRIKIIQLDTPENEIITTIQSIDVANNRMVVSTWNNYSPASNIFVYGTEVDDFLSVDKPQLGVMALQGVKELHQIIRQQEERIVRLEALLSSRAV